MRDEFRPAIEAAQEQLADQEKQVRETKKAIEAMCVLAKVDPMYLEVEEGASKPASIRADTFYGKRMSTAAREYLEMRRTMSLGPASPREVYEALTDGGFSFDTKDEQTALVSLRATLRKSSSIFHRLPNGQYGLLKWYEHVKAERNAAKNKEVEEEDEEAEAERNG